MNGHLSEHYEKEKIIEFENIVQEVENFEKDVEKLLKKRKKLEGLNALKNVKKYRRLESEIRHVSLELLKRTSILEEKLKHEEEQSIKEKFKRLNGRFQEEFSLIFSLIASVKDSVHEKEQSQPPSDGDDYRNLKMVLLGLGVGLGGALIGGPIGALIGPTLFASGATVSGVIAAGVGAGAGITGFTAVKGARFGVRKFREGKREEKEESEVVEKSPEPSTEIEEKSTSETTEEENEMEKEEEEVEVESLRKGEENENGEIQSGTIEKLEPSEPRSFSIFRPGTWFSRSKAAPVESDVKKNKEK